MLQVWILPVLGLIAVFGLACGGSGDDLPTAVATATPTASAASFTATASPVLTSPTASTASPTWNTLINVKHGYSVEYPSSWIVNPYGGDPSMSADVDLYNYAPPSTGAGIIPPPDKVHVELVVLNNSSNMPLADWVNEYYANSDSKPPILSSTESKINGLTEIEQVILLQDVQVREAFFALTGKTLLVNGPRADSLIADEYKHLVESIQAH